jgi:hypothetical protein
MTNLVVPLIMLLGHTGTATSTSPGLRSAVLTTGREGLRVGMVPMFTLFWCVADVQPGETLMCGVGQTYGSTREGLSDLTFRVTPAAGQSDEAGAIIVPAVLSPSGGAVSALIPESAPRGVYLVQLANATSAVALSNVLTVNRPELWWVQGDSGQAASPGGWIRIFGRGLTLPSPAAGPCPSCDRRALATAIARATKRLDWQAVGALAAHAERLAAGQTASSNLTTLNLTSSDGHSILLHASPQRLSTYSAEFAVPPSMVSSNYSAVLSNGQAATRLGWFASPEEPAKSVVEVIAQSPTRAPPQRTFRVSDFGCAGGINRTNPKDLTVGEPVNCTEAVTAALRAAAELSPAPSTVLFPAGRWYLHPPLLLPDGVTLAGESTTTTALYFAYTGEINGTYTDPIGLPALIGAVEPAGANITTTFGVQDLTIYALSYYSAVINISVNTANVAVRRVRIRANAFNGRNAADRTVPWQDTIGANGPPVILLQGRSCEISSCDIYATWVAIASHGHYGPTSPAHSVRAALIRNNTIWNGGACFWADQAKEVIFEDNVCSGISPMSGGNGIMTYGGGYAQHVFWGHNTIRHVWGNDREVMTFDNRGNQYFGPVVSVSVDGVNVTTTGRGAGDGNGNGYDVRGGAVVVVNGTGAGQIRRILDFRLDDALNGSGWFTIDAPFDTALQPSRSPLAAEANGASLIACIPFRGRDIFYGNSFEDTGAHQLYGIGLDTIVAENTAARFGGFKAWGQGRTGGYAPPQGTEAFFANPNMRSEWIGNRVLEGLRADHQGGSINVSGSFGDAVMNNGNAFEVVTNWGPSWDHDCSSAMFGLYRTLDQSRVKE